MIGKLLNLGFDTIFFNEIKTEMNEKLKICFKQMIEKFDDYILEHKKKHKYKWTCKGFEIKTLHLKELGKLNIKIRKYIVKNNQGKNKVIYPVLYILNNSDDLLMFSQKEKMFATYVQRKSLRSVAELYEMKKDKVHAIIQSLNINFEPQIITNEKLTLFINLDGFWIRNNHQSYKEIQKYAYNGNFKQNDKREIHSVTLFTHSQQIGNSKKFEIKNKFSYWFDEKISLEKKHWNFKKNIKIMYPNYLELFVIGDGASWIKEAAKLLNAKYTIDKFHYMKILIENFAKLIGSKKKSMKLITKYKNIFYKEINLGKPFAVTIQKILNQYQQDTGEIVPTEKIEKIFSYNKNHFQNFIDSYKNGYISFIEDEQSRCVGEFLRYSRSSFGIKTVDKIRIFVLSFYNKMNVIIGSKTIIDLVYMNENQQIEQDYNSINKEINYIPNQKGISSKGWKTKKVYFNC